MKIIVITPAGGLRNRDLAARLARLDAHEHVASAAIFLDDLPAEFDDERARAFNNRRLTLGEIGCALSHRAVYDQIIESGDRWACVLEDDAEIIDVDAFGELLDRIERSAPAATGTVIDFYTRTAVVAERRPSVGGIEGNRNRADDLTELDDLTDPEDLIELDDLVDLVDLVDAVSEPSHAVAYCISAEAARRLALANRPLAFTADWPRGTGVEFTVARARVVDHDESSSLIGTERLADRRHRPIGAGNLGPAVIADRLQLYTGVHYRRHRRHFDGLRHYHRLVVRHRIVHLLGRFAGRPLDRQRPGIRTLRRPFGYRR